VTRELSPAEAVALVRPSDTIAIPLGPGAPGDFLHALGERDDWQQLEVFGGLLLDLYSFLLKPCVHYFSGFFGPAERALLDAGASIDFVPADFRRFATIAQQFAPRIMTTCATPPDKDGYMSLSLHAGATVHELHRAGADPDRVLLVETSEHLPHTIGIPPQFRHAIHVDEADIIIAGDRAPFVLEEPPATDIERAIAKFAIDFVDDGSTLQTGIGGVPSTVVALLADESGGDFGVHSEMFTTGLMHLHEAGKVTNARKGEFAGMSIATFALGTNELYAWLDGNPDVRFLPVDVVNAPHTIARNHNVVSINGALAVDLYGQLVADRVHGRQFSGIGGHEDFVAQSGFELEDRSLICMPSTAMMNDEKVSRVLVDLPPGTAVTTPRHQTDVVITEYGVAELRGATVRQRAERLAAIAHPDFRPDLQERAASLR
jgi:acyl-CoA hydrolase